MRDIGGDPFNMTVAGLRLSRAANAVSELHGRTARAMWEHVENAAPIAAITNGVHPRTWQSDAIRTAQGDPGALWAAHEQNRAAFRLEVERRSGVALDPGALWIGFARRAAAYKRGDLILRDSARLERLLAERRVNLIFSGKSHPDDRHGKAIIARLARAQREHPERIAFLEDYDLSVARGLVRGCDVWLNNPILPLEACGTSGMKAALNGVLNLSIRDGWWAEGCEHGVTGWAIGDGSPGSDERDLRALHEAIERDVLPACGDRARWTRMMAASVRMAETRFSAHRMVREYFEKLYGPQEATAPGGEVRRDSRASDAPSAAPATVPEGGAAPQR